MNITTSSAPTKADLPATETLQALTQSSTRPAALLSQEVIEIL
jgi:hypothetical protein